MPINEPTIVEIQATDLISASRDVINDNFTEATTLATDARAGIVQIATETEVVADANDVVMTPSRTTYLLANCQSVLPRIDNLFDLGEASRQFKDAYIKNKISLNDFDLTASGGTLFLDGVAVGGNAGNYVTVTGDQTITSNKTFSSSNVITDLGGSFIVSDSNNGTPTRGTITNDGDIFFIVGTDDLNLYSPNGVSIYNGTDVGFVRVAKDYVNDTKLPTTLGGTTYVDWGVAGAKTIFLDINNAGQTIYIGDESATVNLPDLYDAGNAIKHKGVTYTFIKTNSTSSLQINSSSTVYGGSSDTIGDADLGSVANISTDGVGTFHSITITSVYEGSIGSNTFQATWAVTSKMGTWV